MSKEFTNGYIYKYGLLYVGWIVRHIQNDTPLYYDDAESEQMFNETKITYLCFTFTKHGAFKRLEKRLASGKKADNFRLDRRDE